VARTKAPSAQIESIEQANAVMLDLLKAEVELGKETGAMDLARAEASARFELPIEKLKVRIGDLTAQLQAWYMANAGELERDGRRSVQMLYGVLGQRKGNPTLKPLNRAWTWAAIGVKLRSLYAGRYFQPAPEPAIDREKVRTELTTDELKNVGLKVEQEVRFYVEPDHSKVSA
jgi:phage host-nuclease inhibitor protein Gam